MRQIFHSLPWIPPSEPKILQDLYHEFGMPVVFKNGDYLKVKGEQNRLYLITEGMAAYYIADSNKSHPSILNLLIPGRSACDLSALRHTRVNIHTRAIGKCKALAIPPHIVRQKMAEDAALGSVMAQHVLEKSECSIEAMVANFTLEPRQRLATFLRVIFQSCNVPLADGWNLVPLNLTNELYGLVVNLTRVSVSRIFKDWADAGLLRKTGKQVWVDPKIFEGIQDWLDFKEFLPDPPVY